MTFKKILSLSVKAEEKNEIVEKDGEELHTKVSAADIPKPQPVI